MTKTEHTFEKQTIDECCATVFNTTLIADNNFNSGKVVWEKTHQIQVKY